MSSLYVYEQLFPILCSICYGSCLPLHSALSQEIMYPYGPTYRDLETPKMDDGSSTEIIILMPFIFFNNPYRSIYVSSHLPLLSFNTSKYPQLIREKC